jgi:hypothetical protein
MKTTGVLRTKVVSSAPEPVPKYRGPHLYGPPARRSWHRRRSAALYRAVGLVEVSISQVEVSAA